jgi:hypothetical protein
MSRIRGEVTEVLLKCKRVEHLEQANHGIRSSSKRRMLDLGATDAGPSICRASLARSAAMKATDTVVAQCWTPYVSVCRRWRQHLP